MKAMQKTAVFLFTNFFFFFFFCALYSVLLYSEPSLSFGCLVNLCLSLLLLTYYMHKLVGIIII